MSLPSDSQGATNNSENEKKTILLNAFDIFGSGMLSPGERRLLCALSGRHTRRLRHLWGRHRRDNQTGYSISRVGPINSRRCCHAAATKRLSFAITSSTSHEPPFLLARRFSTLDHITNGRFGRNIVTGWKKSAFQAIGLDEAIDHDLRYERSEEYLRVLYKLWEGSWADDAVVQDIENDIYADPNRVRTIKHEGKFYKMTSKHMVPPSPQRTPFLFQVGTSSAGVNFASTHAEAAFVGGNTPSQTAAKVAKLRAAVAEKGRDPHSLKVFISLCPVLGETDEEARTKLEEQKKYASVVGGLVHISGVTGIDLSKVPLDDELSAADAGQSQIRKHVVELLVPELRRRGIYAEPSKESLTTREQVYEKGRRSLDGGHVGSRYKYAVYRENLP
ncbi:luciferase-like domain-containing protein [Aspergillus varians]